MKKANKALHRTSHKVRRPVNADVGSKKMKIYSAITLLFIFSCGLCLADGPRFGLYFITNNTIQLEKAELESQPLFTEADLIAYYWTNHAFQLTAEASARILSLSPVSARGNWFVITANGQRCYVGAFWTMVSSLGCPHPVILIPMGEKTTTFQIDAGYPSGKIPAGYIDQRNNETIKNALREAGKLNE